MVSGRCSSVHRNNRLRARGAVIRVDPRIVPVDKELDVVSLSTGATAGYSLENALIVPSEPTPS